MHTYIFVKEGLEVVGDVVFKRGEEPRPADAALKIRDEYYPGAWVFVNVRED